MKFKGGCNPITHPTLIDPPMKHKVHFKTNFQIPGGEGGPDFPPQPTGSAYSVWIDRKLHSRPLTM